MLSSAGRKRVRPSPLSLGFSLAFTVLIMYFASLVFGGYVYLPFMSALGVAGLVVWVRYRPLRRGLPEPYGKGEQSVIDARKAMRQALSLVALTAFVLALVFGGAYFLPPAVFYLVFFGIAAGLPIDEVALFALVFRLEKRASCMIYLVTEETQEGANAALLKTYALVKNDRQPA